MCKKKFFLETNVDSLSGETITSLGPTYLIVHPKNRKRVRYTDTRVFATPKERVTAGTQLTRNKKVIGLYRRKPFIVGNLVSLLSLLKDKDVSNLIEEDFSFVLVPPKSLRTFSRVVLPNPGISTLQGCSEIV